MCSVHLFVYNYNRNYDYVFRVGCIWYCELYYTFIEKGLIDAKSF